MKFATILFVCAALPLASCDSGPEVDARNASASDVAKQVRQSGVTSNFVNPGRWESKVTIEEMTMPGMPPEMAANMKSMAGREQTHTSCLTEEEAKRPKEDFFAGGDKNCRYDHFTMGNGKIDAVMKCKDKNMAQTMAMQGTYGGDAYNMQMRMTGEAGGGPQGGMTMKMRVDAKRVGACDGSEDA